MSDGWTICQSCAGTGFSDRVMRGTWVMQPTDKLCKECHGRGWRPDRDACIAFLALSCAWPLTWLLACFMPWPISGTLLVFAGGMLAMVCAIAIREA
jgi:hypothetical protein